MVITVANSCISVCRDDNLGSMGYFYIHKPLDLQLHPHSYSQNPMESLPREKKSERRKCHPEDIFLLDLIYFILFYLF